MSLYRSGCAPGLTLIEMLLALTLSVILLMNFSSVYVFVKKYYRQQSALMYVQQNQRLLVEILRHDVHQVGLRSAKYYFIEKTMRFNPDHTPVYALYRKEGHYPKTEIIENVQSLTIRYDQVENNHLVEKDESEITNSKKIVGIAFYYSLRDPVGFFHPSGYFYASIRKRHRVNVGINHVAGDDVD